MSETPKPEFSPGTLVIFVGHSDDAREEAEAIVGLQSELQKEIEKRLEVMPKGARFTKVKVWEWRYDAKPVVGGQEKAVTPSLELAHVAIFVFKTRVGPVTWDELNDFRDRKKDPCPVIALFSATPPNPEQILKLETAENWCDLLKKKRELTSDWVRPEGSKAVTPVEDFRDREHLLDIVRDQFGRVLSGLLKHKAIAEEQQQSAAPTDIRTEFDLRIAYEKTVKSKHPCNGVQLDDLDWTLVEEYRKKDLGEAGKGMGQEELLSKLGLFSPLSGTPRLHNAAVLCFCSRPHQFIPSAIASFIVGRVGADSFQMTDVTGPLSKQVQQLILLTRDRLAKISTIGSDGLRKEDTEIPLNVLREAISNAVAHRDYHKTGTIQVRLLENCLEIQNPGCFPPGTSWELFLREDLVSCPSDMAIALYLKRLYAVEAIGRGFSVFREHIRKYGADSIVWRMPTPEIVLVRIKRFEVQADTAEFQAFLAFSNEDRFTAHELKRLLSDNGLTIWLDDDEARPNTPRQQLLMEGVSKSSSIIVLLGEDGLGPYQNDEMKAAVESAVENGRPLIPVLLPDAPLPTEMPALFSDRTWVDLSNGLNDENTARLIGSITGKKPERIVDLVGPVLSTQRNTGRLGEGTEQTREAGSGSTPDYECDVFISYSSKDKEWVRGELLTRIEEAGLKAFIDFRDFRRGAPSIKECERGVKNSRMILAILTPNYVNSRWTEIESIMVQTLDPSGSELRIIPLLKDRCKIPLRMATLTYVDFTVGADLDLAWRQLLTALGKPPEPGQPKQPKPEGWFLAHPYPMPPNFTGRVEEREMLNHWLDSDNKHPLLSIRALGGFGKSALVWHWLTHDVKADHWPRVVWWSFYEGDSSFDHFLTETLSYLSGGTIQPEKLSAKDAIRTLLQILLSPGTLLVLDGFERVLRAFGGLDAAYRGDDVESGSAGKHNDHDCISPLADYLLHNVALQPNLRSKVLLTTRLCPRVLEAKGGGLLHGCHEKVLMQMQPADAVEFFHAQGIRGLRNEIEEACAPYGYHPLSLRLLAGYIMRDSQQPGDIAASRRLDVAGDLVQRQHHVLEAVFDSLTPERKALLGRIACFRSPVKHDALKTLSETESTTETQSHREDSSLSLSASVVNLDADLRDLIDRGLLYHDTKEERFDLHPIVRRYAYDRLAAPDRAASHVRLRDYFAAVPEVEKVTRLEDLAPVIELYHHTVRAGQFDEACELLKNRLVPNPLYYQLGAYQLIIDLLRVLFPDGEDRPPRLKDESAQAWTLNSLANSYSLSGQPRLAVALFEQQNVIQEKWGNKTNLAIGLGNVAGMAQIHIGALRAAEANLRRRIALCLEIKDEFNEAIGHQELGRLLAYRGRHAESETELATALEMFEKRNNVQGQGLTWACRALRELLLIRHTALSSGSPFAISNSSLVIPLAQRALELADETARTIFPSERDYVRAHWLLGAAHRVAGENDEAEKHLHEALERCRRINLVDIEANILIEVARLRVATNALDEAQRFAEEALVITERSGYVLQGADAHLELSKLALLRKDKKSALDHAEAAKKLATCDGAPDYTYKAAYDEANALLAGTA